GRREARKFGRTWRARQLTQSVKSRTTWLIEKSLIAVKRPRMAIATTTTTVESRSSVLVGHEAFWSSSTISPRKMRVLRNGFFILEFGRRGGTRTPNRRFWRPLLYQLS